MSSIAIFPCTFINADSLVSDLAVSMELEIYDDERLISDTAARLDISADKLREALYYRTSVFNQFTLERERAVNLLKATLAAKLEESDSLLFSGFHSVLIPPSVTHVLKILAVDSKQNRIDNAVNSGMSEKEAKKTIRVGDVSAYDWTDFLYSREAFDSILYDVVIPVEGSDEKDLINQIKKCFQTTSVLKSAPSRQAVVDFKIAVDIEKALLDKGHNMKIKVNNGMAKLSVSKTVLNFGRLGKDLAGIAGKVEGVKGVEVKKGAGYSVSVYRQQKFELPSRVLFVDDEKEFVQTVSSRLINRDVGTYGVFNGDDALELVVKDRPEVMVLDLKMPGMHGVEVLRRTKELAPEVEVIILTGHGTSEDMRQCMEFGAFAYMNKPVDIEELSATISAANEVAVTKRAA